MGSHEFGQAAKNSYDFKISGVPFRLRSVHDAETVQSLVQYVDDKINQALQSSKSASFQNSAVLAALNIAEELILLKKNAFESILSLEQKVERLSKELEKSSGASSKNFIEKNEVIQVKTEVGRL